MLEKIYYDSCRVALNLDAEKANDLAYDIFKLLCEEKAGIETMPRNAWVGVTVENKKEGL